MTTDDLLIVETAGEHAYLLRLAQGDDVVEIVLRLDRATMDALAADGTDEERVVEAVMTYLTERQRADDLPASLDLADIAAAYEGWTDEMRTRLHDPDGEPSRPEINES
jgi:hypothetical protein